MAGIDDILADTGDGPAPARIDREDFPAAPHQSVQRRSTDHNEVDNDRQREDERVRESPFRRMAAGPDGEPAFATRPRIDVKAKIEASDVLSGLLGGLL